MKKILTVAFAIVLAAGCLQAQNKNVKRSTSGISSSIVNGTDKADDNVAVAPKIVKLPLPETGMEKPFRKAMDGRKTIRRFSEEPLSDELVSSLLWCAYGYNRPNDQRRTAPSAINAQEYDIYVFTREGIFQYNAKDNALELIAKDDSRAKVSEQKFFGQAPVVIVLVANYDRMTRFTEKADRDFYAAVDAGYISQNIYLFCSSADLGTVACGAINRDAIQKMIGFKNGRAMLAHPVGIPMEK